MGHNGFTLSGKRSALRPAMAALALAGATLPVAVQAAPSGADSTAEAVYPAYHGPRKTLAVAGFEATGAVGASSGNFDIGSQLAAMLATELARTNRFVLVERADLGTLAQEQQMAANGMTTGQAARPLLGAQFFVRGVVTEFEEQTKGSGFQLGLGSGNLLGGLGGNSTKGHIAMDLRVIDAGTGAIVSSFRVEKTLKGSSFGLQLRKGAFAASSDGFEQTSVGKAARAAIAEAAGMLVAQSGNMRWAALVSEVDGDRVYINAGADANLTPGARLRVVRTTRQITDPATGQVLGLEQRTLGDFVLENVAQRYAVGRLSGQAVSLQRGDTVYYVDRPGAGSAS